MSLIDDLAQAVAQFEGYFRTDYRTVAQRNNNPGNLRYAGQRGAVGQDAGYAVFGTPEEGWEALRRQVRLDVSRGLTLEQWLNKYAPPSDNNPTESYINFVAGKVGIPRNVPLDQLAVAQQRPLPEPTGPSPPSPSQGPANGGRPSSDPLRPGTATAKTACWLWRWLWALLRWFGWWRSDRMQWKEHKK